MRLFELYEKLNKYLIIEDTEEIDLILATAFSSQLKDIPIWLINVAPSGHGKTELVKALLGWNHGIKDKIVKVITRITPNTLVTGRVIQTKKGIDIPVPDLAPTLNGKVVIVTDFATILTMDSDSKKEVFAQFRDLYDGHIGRQAGTGVDKFYNNLRITLIGCSTPVIDNDYLMHQILGNRELFYRPKKRSLIVKKAIIKKIYENAERKAEMEAELSLFIGLFLDNINVNKTIIFDEEIEGKINQMANWLCYMRAQGEMDSYKGELKADISPEEPTRINRQLYNLYKALMLLDSEYSIPRALNILWRVVQSSANQRRLKIIKIMQNSEFQSTNEIANKAKLGWTTVFGELSQLDNLGLVLKQEIYSEISHYKKEYEWKLISNEEFSEIVEGNEGDKNAQISNFLDK